MTWDQIIYSTPESVLSVHLWVNEIPAYWFPIAKKLKLNYSRANECKIHLIDFFSLIFHSNSRTPNWNSLQGHLQNPLSRFISSAKCQEHVTFFIIFITERKYDSLVPEQNSRAHLRTFYTLYTIQVDAYKHMRYSIFLYCHESLFSELDSKCNTHGKQHLIHCISHLSSQLLD